MCVEQRCKWEGGGCCDEATALLCVTVWHRFTELLPPPSVCTWPSPPAACCVLQAPHARHSAAAAAPQREDPAAASTLTAHSSSRWVAGFWGAGVDGVLPCMCLLLLAQLLHSLRNPAASAHALLWWPALVLPCTSVVLIAACPPSQQAADPTCVCPATHRPRHRQQQLAAAVEEAAACPTAGAQAGRRSRQQTSPRGRPARQHLARRNGHGTDGRTAELR
jgi:hypothetical protein